MPMFRRDVGLWVASSLVVSALPRVAFADADDDVKPVDRDKDHHEVHTSGAKHHADATTADHLLHPWSFTFRSKAIAENDWKYLFPENGQASILIDFKGNWQFNGSFPAQPKLELPCRVTVGVGLKGSGLGKILAVTKTLTVGKSGGNWSKQGHDPIVADLWKDVVKAHDWKWAAHTRQEVPSEPPPHDGTQGGGDSTFNEVTGDLAKGLLGPISWFF